jgi:hypothetical protein
MLFVPAASMASLPLGGWLADSLGKRTPRGRLIMQAIGGTGDKGRRLADRPATLRLLRQRTSEHATAGA